MAASAPPSDVIAGALRETESNETTNINGVSIFEASMAHRLFSLISSGFATMEGRLDSMQKGLEQVDSRIDDVHAHIQKLDLKATAKRVLDQVDELETELAEDRQRRREHSDQLARTAASVERDAALRTRQRLERALIVVAEDATKLMKTHGSVLEQWRTCDLQAPDEGKGSSGDDLALPSRLIKEETLSRFVLELTTDEALVRDRFLAAEAEIKYEPAASAELLNVSLASIRDGVLASLSSFVVAATSELEEHKASTAIMVAHEGRKQRQRKIELENIVTKHSNEAVAQIEELVSKRQDELVAEVSSFHRSLEDSIRSLDSDLRLELAREANEAETRAVITAAAAVDNGWVGTELRPAVKELGAAFWAASERFATKEDVVEAEKFSTGLNGKLEVLRERIKVLNIFNERFQTDVDRISGHQQRAKELITAELEEKIAEVLMNYMVSAQSAVTLLPLAGTELAPFQSAAKAYQTAVVKAEYDRERKAKLAEAKVLADEQQQQRWEKQNGKKKKQGLSTLERVILRGARLDPTGVAAAGDEHLDPARVAQTTDQYLSNTQTVTLSPGHTPPGARSHSHPHTTWQSPFLARTQTVPARVPVPAGNATTRVKGDMVFTKHAKKQRPQSAGGRPTSRQRAPGPLMAANAAY